MDDKIKRCKNNWHINLICQILTVLLWSLSYSSHAMDENNVRGQRYCEVIVGEKILSLSVYNTFGLNDCPEKLWQKLSEKGIKAQTSAHFVRLNGPRYWVINGFKHTSLVNKTPINFEGLSMRLAGVLHLTVMDVLHGDKRYKEHHVQRHTTWVYNEGQTIYELIDPAGNVYVMQSYSTQKKSLTETSLATLGKTLALPNNWSFKSGTLKQSIELKTIHNEAVVLQDDLLNTYQKAPQDFL